MSKFIYVDCSGIGGAAAEATYISVAVVPNARIKPHEWYTSNGDWVQKEPISYGHDGEPEVYEAIFPSSAIGSDRNVILSARTLGVSHPWAGSSTQVENLKKRLRTTITTGGDLAAYHADFTGLHTTSVEIVKSGEYLLQSKVFAHFVNNNNEVLSGVGLHYYITERKGMDMIQVDMLFSNSTLYGDDFGTTTKSNNCVKRYYDHIRASLTPSGPSINASWKIVSNYRRASELHGATGMAPVASLSLTNNYIVPALNSGEHLFPCMSWSMRRYFYWLTAPNDAQADAYRSWNHVARARGENSYRTQQKYGGIPKVLPVIDNSQYYGIRENYCSGTVDQILTGCLQGSSVYYAQHKFSAMGLFMPIRAADAGAGDPGGSWIAANHGWHATAKNFEMEDLITAGMIDRDRLISLDSTGNPLQCENWLVGNRQLFSVSHVAGYDNHASDHPKYNRASTASNCPYESTLYGIKYVDGTHKSRSTMHPEQLAWLANDTLAKDILKVYGSYTRLSTTHYDVINPYLKESVSYLSGQADGLGLGWISRTPNDVSEGLHLGRKNSWDINTMCNTMAFESDLSKRALITSWAESMANLYWMSGKGPTGLLIREAGNSISQTSNTAVQTDANMAAYDVFKTFEHQLVLIGLRGLLDRMNLNDSTRTRLLSIYRRSVYHYVINSPLPHFGGVAYYVALPDDPGDLILPPVTAVGGDVDDFFAPHILSHYMYTFGTRVWIPRLLQIEGVTTYEGYINTIYVSNLNGDDSNMQYGAEFLAHLQNSLTSLRKKKRS